MRAACRSSGGREAISDFGLWIGWFSREPKGERGRGEPMRERFVGEPVEPVPGTGDAHRASRGSPGLPQRFRWRGTEYEVAEVLKTWRETGAMKGSPRGRGEQYVRKHWFTVRTASGDRMTLYFERQARRARDRKRRWWLFSHTPPPSARL
jgi:hypothetical protein